MLNQNQNLRPISPAASAAAVAGANNVSATSRISQEVLEARQESQIWTTFSLNPFMRFDDIKVFVRDGKATLSGNVAETVTKDLAMQIALGVAGIRAVDNNIAVDAGFTAPEQSATRSFGEIVEDATISTTVKSKILWSRYAESLSANVATHRGAVVLSGSAVSLEAKHFAGSLATHTHGVRSVNNQLIIVPAKLATVRTDATDIGDAWITTKVKAIFLFSNNVKGSDIAVTTHAGIVKLTGRMDSGADHALAIDLARDVRGVQGVDSSSLTM